MEFVGQRQLGEVGLPIEVAAVEVVQVRVLGRPLPHDPGQLVPDDAQGQFPARALRRVARGPEPQSPGAEVGEVRGAGTGGVLVDGAVDGRDDQQRCAGVAFADGVEETVDGRGEGAQAHQIGVDQVDADLEADQVGGGVAQDAGGERVEQGAAAQTQVDQFRVAEGGGEGGPGGGGARGVGALADRAAVVQPYLAAPVRCGLDGGVGTQGDEFGGLVVRQPDLDVLHPAGQAGEAEGAGRAGPEHGGPGGHVHGQGVAAGHAGPAGQAAVDEQVVHAVRAGRSTDVDPFGGQRVQFDGGGPGAEDQPYPGGLGLRHGELSVGALGAGTGGQPVRQHTVGGVLQVERAAQKVRGDGRGDPAGRDVHGLSLLIEVFGLCGVFGFAGAPLGRRCPAGGGSLGQGAGQFRSRASRASRTRDQVSCVSGALWLNPPPISRLT